jgi:hypothetical protein
MTFDAETLEVRMANRMLRVVKRILGVERLLALLRYAALMTRESHLPAVLLKQPLRLSHKTRR